ncbi:MAG: GNAT family N-acetyltransferase [Verrucomicrobia bacterium]|nr:GNAT family N-acetyltransferase [Verrucomicrobiota bacterium]
MPTERPSYLDLIEESFPGFNANLARCETLGFALESKPFLKEERGEILSHVGFLEYPLLIDGRMHQAGALHAVCTKAAYRKQGLSSELIQKALQWAKDEYEFVILFTAIPQFYEKLSFRRIQEYRFHLRSPHPKGSKPLTPLTAPKDSALFLSHFHRRAPSSNHLWVKENGIVATFNALFGTYPSYWSLHYSPSMDGLLSFDLKDKTLHLYDVIAGNLPTLDQILDHLPSAIDEIYFYFSPDLFTNAAIAEPYLYDKGHFLVHGNWPQTKPFMISPLSRC